MNRSQAENIRHEIRNHLNSISVNAELAKLLLVAGDLDKDRLHSAIQTVLNECKKCSQIISENSEIDSQ